jgi:hypothetical protein
VAGYFNLWLHPGFSVQLDAEAKWTEGNLVRQERRFATVHLSLRNPTSHLFGAFASYGVDPDEPIVDVGVEGQLYFGNTTLYAQAGYLWREPCCDAGVRPYAHLIVRHFVTPNFMIAGNLGFDQVNPHLSPPGTRLYSWGGELELQPHRGPLSVFAAYTGTHLDSPTADPRTTHQLRGGLRLALGQQTDLLHRDRYGATLRQMGTFQGDQMGF